MVEKARQEPSSVLVFLVTVETLESEPHHGVLFGLFSPQKLSFDGFEADIVFHQQEPVVGLLVT